VSKLALLVVLGACQGNGARPAHNAELETYLSDYAKEYQRLSYASQLAEWQSNTHIVKGDSTNAIRTRKANEALARFVGSNDNIAKIRGYLKDRAALSPLQARQLDVMLYIAAEKPETAAPVVARRIAAEAAQTEKLYGFQFKLKGKAITPNAIDDSLTTSRALSARLAVWQASKEVGPVLKPGLLQLRDLRNEVVGALGYSDYSATRSRITGCRRMRCSS
jgi:peptidyl-dipeptidase A